MSNVPDVLGIYPTFGDVFQKGKTIVVWLRADNREGTWTGVALAGHLSRLRTDWVVDGWTHLGNVLPQGTP